MPLRARDARLVQRCLSGSTQLHKVVQGMATGWWPSRPWRQPVYLAVGITLNSLYPGVAAAPGGHH